MNQIEWCQVRLDITHEIQLPGDPSYPEIQVTQRSSAGKFTRRSSAGKFTWRSGAGKLTRRSGAGKFIRRSGAGKFTRRSGTGKFTWRSGAGKFTQRSSAGKFTQRSKIFIIDQSGHVLIFNPYLIHRGKNRGNLLRLFGKSKTVEWKYLHPTFGDDLDIMTPLRLYYPTSFHFQLTLFILPICFYFNLITQVI